MIVPNIIFFLIGVDFALTDETCQNYYKQQGVCVPLDFCASLSRLYSDPNKSFYDRMIIDRSYCKGFYNKDKVCCADAVAKSSTIISEISTKSTVPTKSSTIRHSNGENGSLPMPGQDGCGLQVIDKIVGGNVTAINEYPWLATLEYKYGKI